MEIIVVPNNVFIVKKILKLLFNQCFAQTNHEHINIGVMKP